MQLKKDDIRTIQKITWLGAFINILLAAAKILVGIIAFSQSLIADGIHSLSDLVTDAAVLIGSKFWGNEPDKKHPYGHGRIETLVSLGIGIGLAIVAIGIIRDAILSFKHPQVTPPGWIAFIVALISVASKEYIFRLTVKTGKKINSRALIANAWHHRTDALSSIPVALAVIGTHVFPTFVYFDQIATIIVSLMLLKAAYDIAHPCISELMEEQVHVDIEGDLLKITDKYPQIVNLHDIRIRRVGTMHFIEMHMFVKGDMSVNTSHALTEEIESTLHKNNQQIADVTIHIEPAP